jgi:hypothetical protein
MVILITYAVVAIIIALIIRVWAIKIGSKDPDGAMAAALAWPIAFGLLSFLLPFYILYKGLVFLSNKINLLNLSFAYKIRSVKNGK